MFSLEIDCDPEDRDLLIAELWEQGSAGIVELNAQTVRSFFEGSLSRTVLLRMFPGARIREEEERDWVQSSRDLLQPMEVGRRFFLVPEWRDDPAPDGRFRIVVNPGMAFGTGVHETTRLCIEALEDFLQPGMSVLDVSTGGGYTSQLLALVVGPDGVLWAQAPQPGATVTKRLSDNPQANFRLVARPFENPVPEQAPPLDLITIVLNYHDIAYLPVDRAKMDARLFAALKPGGRLVVIDHSAKAGTGVADTKTLHRIDEAVVLAEFRQAGFVLEATSDFLRNPADSRELSSGDGRIPTDKFALRFVKP